MPNAFDESQAERMVIDACVAAGWRYVPADDLTRDYGDVLVDSMVKDALMDGRYGELLLDGERAVPLLKSLRKE